MVEYQLAIDPTFPGGGFLSGEITAAESRDYTAKVNLRSELLWPFFTYYYRFRVGDAFSPVGRFKTLPRPGQWIPRLRIGFLSCQDYSNGYYAALQRLAEENVDYVVHLGDYIYETVGDPFFQQSQVRPVGELPSGGVRATTLDDYRFLYRTYRSDPSCRRCTSRRRSFSSGTTTSSRTTVFGNSTPTTPPTQPSRSPSCVRPPTEPGPNTRLRR